MEALYSRCCGLDVHKSSVSACVLLREGGRTQKKYGRYGAMTRDLEELARWLQELGVAYVAMESTGSTGNLCGTFLKISSICFW